ncbi:PagK family vesicle-borne virulence factor [Salmonella enterica]|nr:PagK family vesicle-borne virulence factor [Salmonella enterica]
MRHRIFLPLLLVLSATAFSASAMAASDSKPHQIIQNTPPVAGRQAEALIRPGWCDHWPSDIDLPRIGVKYVVVNFLQKSITTISELRVYLVIMFHQFLMN